MKTEPRANTSPGSPRFLLLVLFGSALFWLFLAAGLNLFASIKLHSPPLLANHSFLSYGRIRAVQETCFIYGFALQAALGISAHLLTRLLNTRFKGSIFAVIGALFWNLGVSVAALFLFSGQLTSYEGLELPAASIPILFSAFTVVCACLIRTTMTDITPITKGQSSSEFISSPYILCAVMWFLWLLASTGLLCFHIVPRGVLQNACAIWFQQNLNGVVLSLFCLGFLFYFIPRELNRRLHSRSLALFALWTIALFGGWGGFGQGMPFPRWLIALSAAGTALLAIPMLAIGINLIQTIPSKQRTLRHEVLAPLYAAAMAYFVSTIHQIIGADAIVGAHLGLTLFSFAQKALFSWGFVTLALLGGVLIIAAEVFAWELRLSRLSKICFGLFLAGIVIIYVSNLVGGLSQGFTTKDFSLTALRVSTIGDLLLFVSILILTIQAISAFCHNIRTLTQPTTSQTECSGRITFSRLLQPTAACIAAAVSWGEVVLLSNIQLGGLQQTSLPITLEKYPSDRPALARRGAQIYRSEGCVTCHTQQVRPGEDVEKGLALRRTVARDYIFDAPPLLGSLRLGPDLANVGHRLDKPAMLKHLKSGVPHSVMPRYRYLSDEESEALVEYLLSLKVANQLYETPK